MKTKYDGTKTLENLKAAFAGESQERNKYDYFHLRRKKMALNKLRQFLWRLR